MTSQKDAVPAPETPKKMGIQELGRMARSLDISRLGTQPKVVAGIDRDYAASGESLARYAQNSETDPLTAARTLVDVDLMNKADPRFAAAMRMRLEPRDKNFVEEVTRTEKMAEAAGGFAAQLKQAGSRQGFLQMKAICMAVEKGEQLDASSMSAKLEGAAMAEKLPEKLRDEMLLNSARYGDAHHIQRQRSREKSAERQDVAR